LDMEEEGRLTEVSCVIRKNSNDVTVIASRKLMANIL
jgi:hypothetical protein